MAPDVVLVALFCGAAFALQLLSSGLVLYRVTAAGRRRLPGGLPPVSVLRPVCGIENHIEETLASTFALEHPCYEIVFCVASAGDPVIPLVERLIAAHPGISARLLVGDNPVSGNPKLNNLVKGWKAARHDWIVMADSNVALPADYLETLFARWTPDTGLVSSPPAGTEPEGFWAELESGFLNTYQARWQLAADQLGLGFAQGKNLFWRRDILEGAGGIVALGDEMAEDVAATKLVRKAGRKVRLVRRPFAQPLGSRTLAEVWRRQLRWARVRKMGFAGYFAAEIVTGPLLPFLGGAWLVGQGVLPGPVLVALCLAWYLAEVALARAAGWPASFRCVLSWLLRDLMLPMLWVTALAGSGLQWRGNRMAIDALPVPSRTGMN